MPQNRETRENAPQRQRMRWHILVFLLPAILIYTTVMIMPVASTLVLSAYTDTPAGRVFSGLDNYRMLFGDARWSADFWNALRNNAIFFAIHMLVQNPMGIALAALLSIPNLRFAALYRSAIFVPTLLSFVIVGFIWKLILSPTWGVTPALMDLVGMKHFFSPWLGKQETALFTVSLISVWQYVGVPMMLIYAALLNIPQDVLEAAELDGISGMRQFWKIRLPLILPLIGIISILTFVANFNAFDLVYTMQGALAGPNGTTDILGTLLYRTFFGFQLQLGNQTMGATIASVMFGIILIGVCLYLFTVHQRLRRYQF